MIATRIRIFSILMIFFIVADAAYTAERRPLQYASHRGHYFSWAAPAHWKSSETMNGITLTSPDNKESVSFAILLRSRGQISPISFLKFMLSQLPGYANIRVITTKTLPEQRSGIPGTSWKVIEAEMSYTVNGKPFHAIWTCAVNNYYGIYDASVSGYQASKDTWSRSKAYLQAIANRIVIINPRQLAGNDTLIPVKNRPLDNSGTIKSGRMRSESQDRISKKTREGIMGQERVKDPSTGEAFDMPLNRYDPTAGGYRNPRRPDELLVPTVPGE